MWLSFWDVTPGSLRAADSVMRARGHNRAGLATSTGLHGVHGSSLLVSSAAPLPYQIANEWIGSPSDLSAKPS